MRSLRFLSPLAFAVAAFVAPFVLNSCSSSTEPGVTKTHILTGPTGTVAVMATEVGRTTDTTITVKNTGNDSLSITGITSSDSNFTIVSTTPIGVASNGEKSVTVRFHPAAVADYNTSIRFTLASNDSTAAILLSGKGLPFHPRAGSTFTYTTYAVDSTGAQAGGSSLVAAQIVSTTEKYQGRDSVVEILEGSDTTYHYYEANGDIAVYNKGLAFDTSGRMSGAGWIDLPFASHTTGNAVLTDSEHVYIDVNGVAVSGMLVQHGTASYISSEEITVGSEKLTGEKVVLDLTVSLDILSQTFTAHAINTYWYSQKLGYLIKEDSRTTSNFPNQDPFKGGVSVLNSYNVK